MMATRFATQFARSGAPRMVRQNGEPTIYHPRGGGDARPIQATVERGTLEIIAEVGDITGPALICRVQNSATLGISSSEIDTGGDQLEVPLRVGGTAQRRSIVRILSDSAGLVRFLCQ